MDGLQMAGFASIDDDTSILYARLCTQANPRSDMIANDMRAFTHKRRGRQLIFACWWQRGPWWLAMGRSGDGAGGNMRNATRAVAVCVWVQRANYTEKPKRTVALQPSRLLIYAQEMWNKEPGLRLFASIFHILRLCVVYAVCCMYRIVIIYIQRL